MALSEQDRADLQAVLRSDSYDGSPSSRAEIVLLFDEGVGKSEIAVRLGTTRPTVDKWLERYARLGLQGLASRTSPGGSRQIPDRIRAKVAVLGISHWSSAEMARYVKMTEGVYVSQTWVSRVWRQNGLKPWRQGTFKISKDRGFEGKVRDIAPVPAAATGRGRVLFQECCHRVLADVTVFGSRLRSAPPRSPRTGES